MIIIKTKITQNMYRYLQVSDNLVPRENNFNTISS